MGKLDPAPTMAAGLIRLARLRAGIGQRELAELAGVTQQTISAYETGRREPTLPTLQKLLGAAGFDLRVHLEEHDVHDENLAEHMASLPARARADWESNQRSRVAADRLKSVRRG